MKVILYARVWKLYDLGVAWQNIRQIYMALVCAALYTWKNVKSFNVNLWHEVAIREVVRAI